jgi:hypothetical protein
VSSDVARFGIAVSACPRDWAPHEEWPVGVGSVLPFPASEADRQRVARDTARVALLVAGSTAVQRQLLYAIANRHPEGRFVLADSTWVEHLLDATRGIVAADVEGLANIDWSPSASSKDHVFETVQRALRRIGRPNCEFEK